MSLLSLDKSNGLNGLVSAVVLRTEGISAASVQDRGAVGLVAVHLKSGESVPLDCDSKSGAEKKLLAKIKAAP